MQSHDIYAIRLYQMKTIQWFMDKCLIDIGFIQNVNLKWNQIKRKYYDLNGFVFVYEVIKLNDNDRTKNQI